MHETKFFINSKQVGLGEANQHWLNSRTYAMAKNSTRDRIWRIATKGDSNGNHNPEGEIEHLKEAGITLSA